VAKDAVRGFQVHDGPVLAAAIAYHALLSVFPLFVVALAAAATFVDEHAVQAALARTLALYLPPEALEEILRNVAEAKRARGPVGTVAAAGFLWASSAAAGVARRALNRIWDVRTSGPWWKRKPLEVVATVVVAGIFGASLLGSVALPAVERLGMAVPGLARLARYLSALGAPAVLAFLAFLWVYRVLPHRRSSWRELWPGALVAAVLFELSRQVVFWSVGRVVHYQLVYGSLGGVVVFLVWGYGVAAGFLFGAEVSRAVNEQRGAAPRGCGGAGHGVTGPGPGGPARGRGHQIQGLVHPGKRQRTCVPAKRPERASSTT